MATAREALVLEILIAARDVSETHKAWGRAQEEQVRRYGAYIEAQDRLSALIAQAAAVVGPFRVEDSSAA